MEPTTDQQEYHGIYWIFVTSPAGPFSGPLGTTALVSASCTFLPRPAESPESAEKTAEIRIQIYFRPSLPLLP